MNDSISVASNLDVAFPAGGGPARLTEAQIAAVAGGCDCGCEHPSSGGPPGGPGDKTS